MLRDGTPRWLAVLFVVAAATSFGVNVQDDRMLLGSPVGAAWGASGVHALLTKSRSAAPPPPLQVDRGPAPHR